MTQAKSSNPGASGLAKQVKLLIVEDERTIARTIAERFKAENWQVLIAHDGPSAVQLANKFHPEVVILDIMLPGFDGIEVCRRLQTLDHEFGVLMLTARDNEIDMLLGLGVGADDYMTKPFSMRELVARVKALVRRLRKNALKTTLETPEPTLVLGNLTIDRSARRVTRAGSEAHLTPTEYDLLLCLAASPGTVLTREQLLEEVWDWVDASGTRTVDSHIKALRRKLGSDLVRTVHGVGYALEVSPEQV